MTQRVSLFDPLLYHSTYINPILHTPLKKSFLKKFNFWNLFFNIIVPIFIFVFVLFVLKAKYISKKHKITEAKNAKMHHSI